MGDVKVHALAARWETMCGLILIGAILPVPWAEDTRGTDARGVVVTYVRFDVTCRRCLKGMQVCWGYVKEG